GACFSVDALVRADPRSAPWADVEPRHGLAEGSLPIPDVTWRRPEWERRVSSFASGTRASSQLVARYELRNLPRRVQQVQLVLAVRPFQVNPPTQFLNTPGGVSPIPATDS